LIRSTLLATLLLGSAGARAADAETPPAMAAVVEACLSQANGPADPGTLKTTVTVCSLALQSTALSDPERVTALEHRGVAHRNAGSLDKSLADLQAARKLVPDQASVARMLAWTYRSMGRMAEAEAEYDAALKLDAHWQGYLSRCVVRIDQKDYAKALDDCEKAHTLQPSEDSTYFTGVLYAENGRPADAIRLLEAATKAPADAAVASGRVYGVLAAIYTAAGKAADAKRVAAEGRKRFPADGELTQPPPRR
jgi:tetratricopeptide (TPR) repeat protein